MSGVVDGNGSSSDDIVLNVRNCGVARHNFGCSAAYIGFTVSEATHIGHRVMVCALHPAFSSYCSG